MSMIKREMERLDGLNFQAIEVAKQAGAVKTCDHTGHEDCYTDQFDDDARKRAFAIGTNLWKAGEVEASREEFMEAIDNAIKMSPMECPECDHMMSKAD
jgi:hypothetical protein